MITKHYPTFKEWVAKIVEKEGFDEEVAKEKFEYVIAMMERYIPEEHEDKDIQLSLFVFDDWGSAPMSGGEIIDKNKTYHWNKLNMYGRNMSQMIFNFGVVFRNGTFSVHT